SLLLGGQLELPSSFDETEALGDEVDERGVEPVYLCAHLAHIGAVFRSARAHWFPPISALQPPALRHREAPRSILDDLARTDQRALVERLADELQAERRALARETA